jgi:hypothetical protein
MKKSGWFLGMMVITALLAVSWQGAVLAQAGADLTDVVVGTLADTPAWSNIGDRSGSEYGYAVSLDGDFNADGYRDLLVGSPKTTLEEEVSMEGMVQVYYGSAGGAPSLPDRTYSGGLKGSRFGNAVTSAGDVNGDGYDDALIGAFRWQNNAADPIFPNEGAAFVYYGSFRGLAADPAWFAVSGQKDAAFGYSAAAAGDVNNDGYADIIVGARVYTHIYNNEGAAFVYLGSPDGTSLSPDWTTYGGKAVATYGHAVSGVGDVNGDGYDDVLVGAPGYSVDGQQSGAVFLFYGSESGLNLAAGWSYISPTVGARLGEAVSPAGDLNQDGFADFLVGMPGYAGLDGTQLSTGGVLVFYGGSSGPAEAPDLQILGEQAGSMLGFAVAAAGDINQDGVPDIVYGAYNFGEPPDKPNEGKAYVASGAAYGGNMPVLWSMTGEKADASFGYALSTGDLNGDGFIDLAVGAPYYRSNTDILGKAFVYLGCLQTLNLPIKVFLPLLRQ